MALPSDDIGNQNGNQNKEPIKKVLHLCFNVLVPWYKTCRYPVFSALLSEYCEIAGASSDSNESLKL